MAATTARITCGTTAWAESNCQTNGYATNVRLVRDLSFGHRCREGQTWGHTESFVWVNQGCRGTFEVTYRDTSGPEPLPPAGITTRQITCGALITSQQRTCETGGYATSVRLVKDLSGRRCRQGQNWGSTDSFIWTNRGCQAVFEVTYRGTDGPEPLPPAGITTRQITCGTFSTSQQVTCKTNGYATSVRLVTDLSGRRCQQGQNWGHTDSFIWTNRGCRAVFEVVYGGNTPQPMPVTRVISCGNGDDGNVSCNPFGKVASVRLRRDLSGGRCRQWSTWGYSQSNLWVKQGCYGDFEVSYIAAVQPR